MQVSDGESIYYVCNMASMLSGCLLCVCVVGVEQGSSWKFMRGLVSHFREMMVWWIGQRACALSLCVCVCAYV